MTDRIRHLTITLDEDMRDDDVTAIVSAIEHVRGVAVVTPHVVTVQDHLARKAVQAEIQQQLHEAVDGVFRWRKLKELKEH
jgi:hypothetical protein